MKYLKNSAALELNKEKCTGCALCIEVCPHGVFSILDKKAEIADIDSCMECGACMKNCEFNAIQVRSGTGCASAIIYGILNNTEPSCDCSGGSSCC